MSLVSDLLDTFPENLIKLDKLDNQTETDERCDVGQVSCSTEINSIY